MNIASDDVSSIDLETMGQEVQKRQGEVEDKEDILYEKASPKGKFSDKSLNALVQSVNRLTPLFGIKDTYPAFEKGTQTELPAEFIRLLSMFKTAIADAIEEGILPEDAMIDLSVITDDNGIQALAGRISMAAKNGGFKRFLNQKTGSSKPAKMDGKPMEEEMDMEDEMSTDKTEDLFASRM